jgi:predicted RNA methylase
MTMTMVFSSLSRTFQFRERALAVSDCLRQVALFLTQVLRAAQEALERGGVAAGDGIVNGGAVWFHTHREILLSMLHRAFDYIRALHRSSRPIDDAEVDALLGIRRREGRLDHVRLAEDLGVEQFSYDDTPYEVVREALHRLAPRRGDVFYDLGCGYGRVVLWGSIVSAARFHGVELVPQRIAVADRARRRLALRNLVLHQANVRSVGFDDGTLFFLFDPFFNATLEHVTRRLRRIAHEHPIRIASYWGTGRFFARRRWLRELECGEDPNGLRIFDSKKE